MSSNDQGKLRVRYTVVVRKFDGEYHEGKEPVAVERMECEDEESIGDIAPMLGDS